MTDIFPDAGAKAWLYKYAKRNYWRVAAWIDFDDLVQDGYNAYYETRMRYPKAVEPAHIQSLFQLVFRSKIEDLVRANTKQIDTARSDIVEIYEPTQVLKTNVADFNAMIVKAPDIIKQAILLITERANEVLAKPFTTDSRGHRETLNERLCSFLKLDPKDVDIVSDMRAYFVL